MRKQQIIILGIVFGISLLGLIILQTSYFQTAYEVKKEQFFYSANRAMDDMVRLYPASRKRREGFLRTGICLRPEVGEWRLMPRFILTRNVRLP